MRENYKRFADKYFETLNAKESAIYAGFSPDTAKQKGYTLLQRDDVQDYLSELRKEYQQKSGITKEWIIERFKSISDRCMQAEPVMIRDGKDWIQATDPETGEGLYQFDSTGANVSTAHLGKIIGVFEKDNEQLKSQTQNIINLGSGVKPDETT